MTENVTTPSADAGNPDAAPQTLRDLLDSRTPAPATPTPQAPTTGRIIDAAFEENIVGSLLSSKSISYGLFGGDETPISDADLNQGTARQRRVRPGNRLTNRNPADARTSAGSET